MTDLPIEARGEAPGRGRLRGRGIVVVGAGTRPSPPDELSPPIGNGRAIAVLAAREGATVVCVDRDAGAAQATAALVVAEGARAEVVEADVADAEQCAGLVAASIAHLGRIDGIVLNVGIGVGGKLAGTSVEQWDEAFAVNLRAHFLIARAALPELGAGASIVFISSVAGLVAGTRIPSYDASKAGLGGLCRHVALEGGRRGVRANVVAPGIIDTPLGREASRGRPSRERTPVPLGRQASGWEVAYPTVFLLSDEASYITGHTLVVDGGLTAT